MLFVFSPLRPFPPPSPNYFPFSAAGSQKFAVAIENRYAETADEILENTVCVYVCVWGVFFLQ